MTKVIKQLNNCRNCGAPIHGNYCAYCGTEYEFNSCYSPFIKDKKTISLYSDEYIELLKDEHTICHGANLINHAILYEPMRDSKGRLMSPKSQIMDIVR